MQKISIYKPTCDEERIFLDLLTSFIAMYQDRLRQDNNTDFSQIKMEAISLINAGKTTLSWDQGKNGVELKHIKYVFVDEFQDFSELFRGLLLAILEVGQNSLVNAVGDNWQMINRFAGSMPELFDQFELDYPNPKTVYLQTNYRSAGGLVEFCNAIMKANGVADNPALPCIAKKNSHFRVIRLDRDQIDVTPREEHYFKADRVLASIFRLFKPITESFPPDQRKDGDNICFAISRTNHPPLQAKADDLAVTARSNREIIKGSVNRWTPNGVSRFFDSITGHKSKGLEADAVILLQPKQFPMIHQRSVFLQFFGDTPDQLLRDELNLFYVSCSRAKSQLYFLPESGYMLSPFLDDLNNMIKTPLWSSFPCRLEKPSKLHNIIIQNGDRDPNALLSARDLLISFGFTSFRRPNQKPTRSQLVHLDYLSTLSYLQRVVDACADFDLKYFILDGLNSEVFCLPGPKSIDQLLAKPGRVP